MSRFLRSPSINPKKKTRTQLEQFLSSAPTYVYNAPLLLPGPRFFNPHPNRNPSFWSSYVLEITYFLSQSKKNLSRNKKIFTEFLEYPVRQKKSFQEQKNLLFGLPQVITDMTISRDKYDEFSKKLDESIPKKPLCLYKSKPETKLK